jgi:hypothetical protein
MPADGAAAARAPGSARRDRAPDGPQAELLHLQQTAGNQAVTGLMTSVQALSFSMPLPSKYKNRKAAPKAAGPAKIKVPPGGAPDRPAIAATASGVAQGGSFGGHAAVFLALPFEGDMAYFFIDLVLDGNARKKGAIDIRVMESRTPWPGESTSTTWGITEDAAKAALAKARDFEMNKRKYTYNYFGIGYRSYNCALFAEKILQAAGVNQTAGLVVSTPLEVALGRKLPKRRKREKKAKGPAPIPAQYEI